MHTIAFVSIFLIAGCGSSRAAVDAPATVVLVGDSIMVGASQDVTRTLERERWTVHVDAVGGSAILGSYAVVNWPDRIDGIVKKQRPDAVVVELGTNDCGCAHTANGIDAIMKRLRTVDRVYWVNVREDSPIPDDPAAMNNAIEQAQDRWPNMHVIDYDQRFKGHTNWVQPDRIHPNERGNQELAKLIEDALPRVRAS
jgi:lysophospholipase L1-like esterase